MSTIINGRLKTTITEVITKELEFELPCFVKKVGKHETDYYYLTEEGGTWVRVQKDNQYTTITSGGLYLFGNNLQDCQPITLSEFFDAYYQAYKSHHLPKIDKSKDDNVQIETITQNKIDSAA